MAVKTFVDKTGRLYVIVFQDWVYCPNVRHLYISEVFKGPVGRMSESEIECQGGGPEKSCKARSGLRHAPASFPRFSSFYQQKLVRTME